jgi:hypothetical protein
MSESNRHNTSGYIALTTMLIVTAVVVTIATTVTYLSIDEGQMSLAQLRSEQARGMVEGCAADALLQLNESGTLPGSVTLPQGSCTISGVTQNGSQWQFIVSGSLGSNQAQLSITAERTSRVRIMRWIRE